MTSIRQQLLDATDELDGIARAVRSLVPSWQRPENFHEAKSDWVARINKLTASLHRPGVTAAAPVRIVVERIVERERVVTVPPRLRICRRHIWPCPTARRPSRSVRGVVSMSDEPTAAPRRDDQTRTPPRLIDVALAIAATGLPVFPCTLKGAPAISKQRDGNGFKDAVTDPDAVRALFARARPLGLVGVPTGTITDRLVLDIDPRHGGDQWERAHRDRLPDTLIHQTKSCGRHYVFRDAPGVRISAGQVWPGVDVRSSGGYAIWPPSRAVTASSTKPSRRQCRNGCSN